jgi:hypothetical protein
MKSLEFNVPKGTINIGHEPTLTPRRENAERTMHPLRFLNKFTLINPEFQDAQTFNEVDIVVLGGSSGVGKTTVFTEARERTHNKYIYPGIIFPVRGSTRPPRESDVIFGETMFEKSLLDFDTNHAVKWPRSMGEENRYIYGFPEIGEHNIVVLSGNNALLKQLADNSELLYDAEGKRRIVRIGVYTDEAVRRKRFLARSEHEISPNETLVRFSDPTESAKDPTLIDLVLDNNNEAAIWNTPGSQLAKFLLRLAKRRDDVIESFSYLEDY